MAALWALGLLTVSIDGVVWGIAAHVLHRALGGASDRWLAPAAVAAFVFVAWDHWIFAALVRVAGIPSSPAVSASRFAEVGVGLAATVAGFRLGRSLTARF